MNHKEAVLKLLNIAEYEPFYLHLDGSSVRAFDVEFRINELLEVESHKRGTMSWTHSCIPINHLLNGNLTIEQVDKQGKQARKLDYLACTYAKACGYHYLAADRDGEVFAYIEKPQRYGVAWGPVMDDQVDPLRIGCPISFLSWSTPVFALTDDAIAKLKEES